jgi:hypothetical protein
MVVCTPYYDSYQGHSAAHWQPAATAAGQVGCTTRHKSVDREVQTGLLGVGAFKPQTPELALLH